MSDVPGNNVTMSTVLCPGVPWPRPAQRTVLLHNRQQSASHLRDTGHVTGPRDSVGARDSGLLSGYDTSTTARSSRGSRSSSSSTDSLASWSSKETHTSNNTGVSAVSHHSHSVTGGSGIVRGQGDLNMTGRKLRPVLATSYRKLHLCILMIFLMGQWVNMITNTYPLLLS